MQECRNGKKNKTDKYTNEIDLFLEEPWLMRHREKKGGKERKRRDRQAEKEYKASPNKTYI